MLIVASAAAVAGVGIRFVLLRPDPFRSADALHSLRLNLIYAYAISLPAATGLRLLSLRKQASGVAGLIPWATVVLLLSCLIGCLVAGIAIVVLGSGSFESFWADFSSSLALSFTLTFAFGLCTWIYETMRDRLESTSAALRERQIEQERSRALLAEARLAAVEAQVQPHFLFNALNSIAAMIPRDPKRAETMVLQVSALLRFSLQAHRTSLVELQKELSIVRAYLEIQKARFGERLQYRVDEPLLAWQTEPVPPMSIQTLVENAVKYAVDPAPEGGSIIVSAERTDDMLWVRVRDSGVGFRIEDSPKGHGLENLRARLDLVYGAPGKAGLRVHTTPEGCCVEMFTPASGATA